MSKKNINFAKIKFLNKNIKNINDMEAISFLIVSMSLWAIYYFWKLESDIKKLNKDIKEIEYIIKDIQNSIYRIEKINDSTKNK